jgi:hypothetical protein
MAHYIFTCLAGIVLGCAFVGVWKRCLSSDQALTLVREFTVSLRHSIKHEDPAVSFQHYAVAVKALLKFISRSVLGLIGGFIPIVLFFYFIFPMFFSSSNSESEFIDIFPATARVLIDGAPATTTPKDGRLTVPRETKLSLLLAENSVRGINVDLSIHSQVFCGSPVVCALFQMSGLVVNATQKENNSANVYVIFRAKNWDQNPLWPFLNDLELLFFISIFFGNLFAIFYFKK